MVSLPKYHALNLLLDKHLAKKANLHCLTLGSLTLKQHLKFKSFIIDSNDCLNSLFPSFDSLHNKLSSRSHLVDKFSNCFSFHIVNCRDKDIMKVYLQNLDNWILEPSSLYPILASRITLPLLFCMFVLKHSSQNNSSYS